VVITTVGGTLGLTSAYGVSDPTITRKRVEADLAVFREYQMKYRGMLEACKQQLDWGLERYAHLPQPPKLLELKPVPSFWVGLASGVGLLVAWIAVVFIGGGILLLFLSIVNEVIRSEALSDRNLNSVLTPIFWLGCLVAPVVGLFDYFAATIANGSRPLENSRRLQAYEEARAVALKAAEPLKAAEDHRLRCQIRELEGLAKTIGEKEADVRRILATL